MKCFKYICVSFLVLCMTIAAGSRTVQAAEEEYTYTIRLYAGNQGILTGTGIDVGSASAHIASGRDCVVISGLKYGDMVSIRPQDAVEVTDERYYVRGVRRSGRDNEEAESPAFYVACDRDFVAAYGVKGDMAAYTVNYQDTNGKTLMKSDTYYGNVGERQFVAFRYIEGYQPQALNMVKTLSANEAENVFTFRYTPVSAGGTTSGGTETTNPPAGTAPGTPVTTTTTTTAADGGNAAGETNDDGADAAQAEDGAQDDQAPEEEGAPIGGDADVSLPDEDVPLDQQKLENLDDEDVPMARIKPEQAGTVMGYLPVYIGIGAAAAAALCIAAVYLHKRRKANAVKPKQTKPAADRKKQP